MSEPSPYAAPSSVSTKGLPEPREDEEVLAEADLTFRVVDGLWQVTAAHPLLGVVMGLGLLALLPSLYLYFVEGRFAGLLLFSLFGVVLAGLGPLRVVRLPEEERRARLVATEAGVTLATPGSSLHLSYDSIESAVRRGRMLVIRQRGGFTLALPLRELTDALVGEIHRHVSSKREIPRALWLGGFGLFFLLMTLAVLRALFADVP